MARCSWLSSNCLAFVNCRGEIECVERVLGVNFCFILYVVVVG